MKRGEPVDFAARRRGLTPWGAAMLCAAVGAVLLTAHGYTGVDALRDEVEQIEQRIAQRQRAAQREQLRQKRLTPEQKRIDRVIVEQRMATTGSGMQVIDWIEHAWTPQIALTSLVVEKAGKVARIEGAASDLSHIYLFVSRLNDRHAERRTGLLQHRTKVIDGRSMYLFSLSVESP
jgi:uracil phosphoribosyltransferase